MDRTPFAKLAQYGPDDKPSFQGYVNADNRAIDQQLSAMAYKVRTLELLVKRLIEVAPSDGVLDEIINNYDGTISII